MEPAPELAPPVVTVTVVHEPGPWFDEVLDGLAEQDFTNLKHLFLVTSDPGDIPARIRDRVPNSFVRAASGNDGFGAACNEVLALVEGVNGFFCFLHDDVALDASAIRLMVEELYRSNAGIVGPKLVTWDDPGILQHVGLTMDRVGEIDPVVEVGEVDQEQHDAVRDVFAVPSACMLVRADLFRELGGFQASMSFHGEDVDLCWRAHLSGARVVVVPSARGRHREDLRSRRADLAHLRLQAEHRMFSVASLTGGRRLPGRIVQLLVFTLIEMVVGIFTGTVRQGWESLKALVRLAGRTPSVIARRRAVREIRRVPDSEVVGLQLRGSARLSSYARSRGARPVDSETSSERRWRESAGSAPAIAWLCVVGLFLFGSRKLLSGGVPDFGQFLPFPASPREMMANYWTGWRTSGLGSSSASPTALAVLSIGSAATLFRMGLWHTVATLGLVILGYLGMWRLASLFPSARARIVALVVYAGVPLSSSLLAFGRWSALICFAAVPWTVYLLRRAVGIDTRGPSADGADFVVRPARRKQIRRVAQLTIVVALAVAFVPSFLLLFAVVVAVLAASTFASGGAWRVAATTLAAGAIAIVGALVLNVPWSFELFRGAWSTSLGVRPIGAPSFGVLRILSFDLANWYVVPLALALYLPVIVAPLLARGWRLAWAVRSAMLVVTFVWLAVLSDRGVISAQLPEPGMLLVPVALGAALAAACLSESFDIDVRGQGFGWRQPLSLLALAGIAVGLIPGLLPVFNGRWDTPRLTLQSALLQLPPASERGDYRVLWVGDPRLVPIAAWQYQPGLAYAISDDGPLYVERTWATSPSPAETDVADALRAIAGQTTLRGGRLLAPFGIRYIVVPLADDAVSPVNQPLPVPLGLIDAFEDQLDLGRPLASPLNYAVYENTAWIPTLAGLTPEGALASEQAGFSAIAQSDASGATPLVLGDQLPGPILVPVESGTVQFGVPYDDRWSLDVGSDTLKPRPSFGSTLAFDVPNAGSATIRYNTPISRRALLIVQLLLWALALLAASAFSGHRTTRQRRAPRDVEPLPDLDLTNPVTLPEATVFAEGPDDNDIQADDRALVVTDERSTDGTSS